MDEVREKYLAWTVTTGQQIIEWAKPTPDWPASPAASWPLTDFTTAASIALGYLAFVFFGRVSYLCY